jgi:hypothetical protein
MNQDSEDVGLGEKLKAVHKGETFRQFGKADQLFCPQCYQILFAESRA